MPKDWLRTVSFSCVAIWIAIWLLFLSIRFSTFDIRIIPGAGIVMLLALATSFLAPIVATVLAIAALIRRPGAPLSWLSFGCAVAAFFSQTFVFLSSRWL